jgi:hypothetical protein
MDKNVAACKKNQDKCTAPFVAKLPQKVSVIHPFHPLYRREFDLLGYRRSWGHECIELIDQDDHVITIPIKWTDAAPEDPFVVIAENRSYFRTKDLIRLVMFIEGFKSDS